MSFFQMSLKALDLNYSACTQKSKILTHLPNQRTSELKKSNHQIRRLHFSEEAATEDKLPVHVILGAANIQRIKTTKPAVLGTNPDTDLGAEFTMLGWIVNVVRYRDQEGLLFEVKPRWIQADVFVASPGTIRWSRCAGFVTWRFQKSVAMSGWWNIFNKVTLEVSSSSFTIKQGTDIEKVTEYCSKKNRKDVKTWRVSHSYGTTVGRKKFRAGTWGTHRGGDSLHPTSSSD